MKKLTGLIMLLLAYGLLYPGVTQPMLTLTGSVDKADMVQIGKQLIIESPDTPPLVDTMTDALLSNMRPEGSIEAYSKTRSILGTAKDLFDNNHKIVAVLIVIFSLVIPILKLLLIMLANMGVSKKVSGLLMRTSGHLSKWSMADVFVIGLFVAFLAANGVQQDDALLKFNATLGPGFYFFLAYCLLSVLSSHLLARQPSDRME